MSSCQKSSCQKGFRVLVVAVAAMVVLAACQPAPTPRPALIFINRSPCDGIVIDLTNLNTNEVTQFEIAAGTRHEVDVQYDVTYTLRTDYTTAATPGDRYRCTLIDEKRILLPQGSIPLTLYLDAELPEGSATP